jgi:hypothetical protein
MVANALVWACGGSSMLSRESGSEALVDVIDLICAFFFLFI